MSRIGRMFAVNQRKRPSLGREHLARGHAQRLHALGFERNSLRLGGIVQVEELSEAHVLRCQHVSCSFG